LDIRASVSGRILANALANIVEQHAGDKKATAAALDAFASEKNVRRVRWAENLTVIPLVDRKSHRIYKGVVGDGNHCYELFVGKRDKWTGDVISKFTANSPGYQRFAASHEFRRSAYSGAPLVMRLIQGDSVRICVDGHERIYRVQRFTTGTIVLAFQWGAGDQERNPLHISGIEPVKRVSPSTLQNLRGRRVFVDILGRVFDPGFKDAAPNTGGRGRGAVSLG
jgi:CRISPR-associated endonuclease Csn1